MVIPRTLLRVVVTMITITTEILIIRSRIIKVIISIPILPVIEVAIVVVIIIVH